MNSKMILSAAVAALIFSSCRKTDNPTPDTKAVLGYRLKAADASTAISGRVAADGHIQWTSGFAYPREMRLEAKNGGNQNADYRTLDTSRIDLFAPASKVFGHVAMEQGNYQDFDLTIKLNPTGIAPGLELKGIYTSSTGATQLPVALQLFDPCEIKTDAKDVAINNNSNFSAVTSLDLSVLSNGITESMMSNAQIKDGILLISRETNKDLHDIIVANLKNKEHVVQVSQR